MFQRMITNQTKKMLVQQLSRKMLADKICNISRLYHDRVTNGVSFETITLVSGVFVMGNRLEVIVFIDLNEYKCCSRMGQ